MEINPYVGVGNIRFGMTPTEVDLFLPSPSQQRRGKAGNLMEARGSITTIYNNTNNLQEVGFSREFNDLTYRGINILINPQEQVLMQLQKLDSAVYESFGFLVFMNLGLALTGFHDDSEDDVAATVFSKGVWSIDKDELKPYL